MNRVSISDITLKQGSIKGRAPLTFKEKIEVAKLLDRLSADVIEIEGITGGRADILRIKSISQAVKHSTVAVPVSNTEDDVQAVFDALREAPGKRLQVVLPVSSVQMEYIEHKKADKLLDYAIKKLKECLSFTENVELVAVDATRADIKYLGSLIEKAYEAGVRLVTICDSAGNMLPEEFKEFLLSLLEAAPSLSEMSFGVSCSNGIAMADACAAAGILCGAKEVKAAIGESDEVSLCNITKLLSMKQDFCKVSTDVKVTEINRISERINRIISSGKSTNSPFEDGVRDAVPESSLSIHDSEEQVDKAVKALGYDLSDEDSMKVYDAFRKIAERKDRVSSKELEAIVASAAMQVPESYRLHTYTVTASNSIDALCHIKLSKNGNILDGVSLGDGPIDAAFLAIEKITGCHYELDDFQIQAITEGREAMGQTIVRLRYNGKLFSGRGISTDIIGSGIKAYINALNKIVYEEEQE